MIFVQLFRCNAVPARYLLGAALFLLFTGSVGAQADIVALARQAPLDEDYMIAIDEWGWEQYYTQRWDSIALVFQIAEQRSRPGVPDDSLQYHINLLSRIRIGQARAERGDLHAGVAQMEAALREGETYFGPILNWSFYHVALALIYEKAGNLNKAVLGHQQASRIIAGAVRAGEANYFLLGNKESNLGRIYSVCNRLPEALVHYQRAIEAHYQAGQPGLVRVGGSYIEKAVTHAKLGQFAAAFAELAQLDNLAPQYRTDWLALAARAEVEDLRGNESAALAAYRRAVGYGRSYIQPLHPFPSHRPRAFLTVRRSFAEFLIRTERLAEAWEVLEEADRIGTDYMPGDDEYHGPIRRLQAEIFYLRGDYTAALEITEQLVAKQTGVPGYRWRDVIDRDSKNHSPYLAAVLDLQAQCLFRLYQKGRAGVPRQLILENCAEGQAIIEAILLSHAAEFKYSQLLEDYRALYDLPVRLAHERWMQAGDEAAQNELFQAIERAKSYDLSVDIRLRWEATETGGALRQLIGEKQALLAQLRQLERRLIDEFSQMDSRRQETKLQLSLRNLQWELDRIEATIRQDYPRYAELQDQTKQSCRLAELQAVLRPQEVVLNYYVGDSLLTVLAVGKKKTTVAVYAAAELTEAVEHFRTLVSTPDRAAFNSGPDTEWRALSYALYDQLVGRLVEDLNASALVASPHGPLHYLPWPALLTDSDSGGTDWRGQPYLLHRYPWSTELSATTLWLQRRLPWVQENDLYLGIAPSYSGTATPAGSGFRSQAMESIFPGYFRQAGGELRYNTEEIAAVQDQFVKKEVLLGPAAEEAAFKIWAPRARYIHLAAHGFANTTHPSYSHLALVPGEAAEDGLVFTDEIYNTPLRADLVVLSACGTGDGGYRRGSGVQSLARAFRAAGSREVLMSLWPIEDRTTFQVITEFFRVLPEHSSATALQQAIQYHLATAKSEAFTHPYYWAGFSLQGPGPIAGSDPPAWIRYGWLMGGGMVVLLGWYSFHRRRWGSR